MPNRMFASAADVEKLVAKARAEHKGGNTMEIIANVGAFPWQINYRTGNTPASIHKHEMELIEVLAGSCTFITGGTLVDAKDFGRHHQRHRHPGRHGAEAGQGRSHHGAGGRGPLVQ